jgi:hypothetical protein
MGPVRDSVWINWLHVVSHCLEDGHSLAQAERELKLAVMAIDALQGL